MADDQEPEETLVFDPSMKKKKKKKKKEPAAGDEPASEEQPAADEAQAGDAAGDAADEPAAEEPVFDGKKKKKKKKKADDDAAGEDGAPPEDAEAPPSAGGMFEKKKKKKKKVREGGDEAAQGEGSVPVLVDADADADADGNDGGAGDSFGGLNASSSGQTAKTVAAPDWADSDRDYTYEEMLRRVFSFLHRANPDIAGRKAFRMKPPQVYREGTKKVVLVNFPEICTSMNRPPEHVLAFMLAELGTSGSLDGSQRVTFKGRFQPKHIESIVRQYLKEYVLCKLCKSPDTKLTRDSNTRLYFMSCNTCGASRSVQPIKSGYQAQIGKRKKT